METRCMQLRVLEKHALVISTLGMPMLRVTVYFKNIGLVMIILASVKKMIPEENLTFIFEFATNCS